MYFSVELWLHRQNHYIIINDLYTSDLCMFVNVCYTSIRKYFQKISSCDIHAISIYMLIPSTSSPLLLLTFSLFLYVYYLIYISLRNIYWVIEWRKSKPFKCPKYQSYSCQKNFYKYRKKIARNEPEKEVSRGYKWILWNFEGYKQGEYQFY